MGAFKAYMAAVSAPGALGVREKKLIALALSVASRCGPCVGINTEAARAAGATEGQISEAVALGIAFGGAAAGMFYSGLGDAETR